MGFRGLFEIFLVKDIFVEDLVSIVSGFILVELVDLDVLVFFINVLLFCIGGDS